MSEYWASRTPRERWLLGIAALLAGLLLLQFGVISPLRAGQAEARLGLETASRQLDVVSAELSRAAPQVSVSSPATASGQDLRTGLLGIATSRGLAVSRLQTAEDGRLILQFDNAAPTLIYAWLADAERTFGAAPDRVSVFAVESGFVRASFEFTGSAS